MFKKEIYQADQETRGIELREEQEQELKKREQLKLSIEKAITDVIDVDIASGVLPTGYITKDLEVLKSHLLPHLQGADNIFAKKSGKLLRDIFYDDATGAQVTESIKEGLAVDELISYLEAKISQTPSPANLGDIQAIKDLLVANSDIYSNLHADDVIGDAGKLEGRILTEGYFVGKNRGVEYENNGLDAPHIRTNPDTTIQGNPNSPDSVINQKKIDADYFRARNLIAGDGANPSERKETILAELDLYTLRLSLNQAKVSEFLRAQGVTDIVNDAQFKQAVYAEMWEILNKEKEAYPILEGIIKKFKDGANSSTLTTEFTDLAQKIGFKDASTGNPDFNRIKEIYDSLNKLLENQAAQNIKKRKQKWNLLASGALAVGGIGVGVCALPVAVLGIVGAGTALSIGAGTAMYTGLSISGVRIGKSIVDWLGLKGKNLEKEIRKMRAKLVDASGALTIDSAVLAEKKVSYECGLEFAKHFAARLAQEKQRDIDNLFISAPAVRPPERADLENAKTGYISTLEAKGLNKISPSKRQKIIDNARNSATEYQDFNQALEKQRTVYAKEVVNFLKERYPDMSDEEAREYAIAVAVYYEMTERGNLEIAEYEKLGIKGLMEGLYDTKIGKVMSAGGGGSEKERMANGLALTVGGALIRAGKFYFKAKHGTLAEIVNWTTNLGGRLLMSHGFGLGARGLTEFAKREALATITYENFRKADSDDKKQAILAKGEALLRDKEKIIKRDASARTALERVAEEVEKMRQYFIVSADNILDRLAEDAAHSIDAAGNFIQVDITKVNEVLQIEDKFKQAGKAYRKKEKAGQAVRRNDIAARLLGLVAFDIGEWAYKKFIPEHKPSISSGKRGGGYGHGRRPATPWYEVPGPEPTPDEHKVAGIVESYQHDRTGFHPHGQYPELGQKFEHEIAEGIGEGKIVIKGPGGSETIINPGESTYQNRLSLLEQARNGDKITIKGYILDDKGVRHDFTADKILAPEDTQMPAYKEDSTVWGMGKEMVVREAVKLEAGKALNLNQLHDKAVHIDEMQIEVGHGFQPPVEQVIPSGRSASQEALPAGSAGTPTIVAHPLLPEETHQSLEQTLAEDTVEPLPTEHAIDIQTIEPRDFAPQSKIDEYLVQENIKHLIEQGKGAPVHQGFIADHIQVGDDDVEIGYRFLDDQGLPTKDHTNLIEIDVDGDGHGDIQADLTTTDGQTVAEPKQIIFNAGTEKPITVDVSKEESFVYLAERIGGKYEVTNDTLKYLQTGDKRLLFCGNHQIEVPEGAKEISRLVPDVKTTGHGASYPSWSLETDDAQHFDGFVFWDQQNHKGVAVLDINQTGEPRSWQITGSDVNQALQKIDNNPALGVEKLQNNLDEVFVVEDAPQTESAPFATDKDNVIEYWNQRLPDVDFKNHEWDDEIKVLLAGLNSKINNPENGDAFLTDIIKAAKGNVEVDAELLAGTRAVVDDSLSNFDSVDQVDQNIVIKLLSGVQSLMQKK